MARRSRRTQHHFSALKSGAGFTLIEILVSVTIFLILLGTLAGIFTTFVQNQRLRLRQNAVLGDLQTFLETIEREVRTAYGNTFDGSAPSSFSFTNQNGLAVTYALSGTAAIVRNSQPLTSGATEVRSLAFGPVVRSEVDSVAAPPLLTGRQGRVTIRVRACPRGEPDERCVHIATTLTARQMAPP